MALSLEYVYHDSLAKAQASKGQQSLSFFSELKRRNVFRVAVAYVVTSWLIAQVAGLAADSFDAPAWVMKMIITMLVLGAPVALVMAWAYELTPGGLRRDAGGDSRQAPTTRLDRSIIIVLVMAVAYFAWDKFILDPQRDEALLESVSTQPVEAPTEDVEQSIAVLSFVNMSDDASNEYFSDGLSEELLNLLVKIPKLQVAARTSSFSYKGKDVKISQIGRELNVSYVLEGSVRKAGNQIRVTAQLIKADDGFHLWSETFDSSLDDVFRVQDEIAAAVVRGLKVSLMGAMPEQRPTDPEVYSLYLQGQHLNRLGGNENAEKAADLLKQAVAIDPEYAPAWSQLQYSYTQLVRGRGIPRDEGIALAMAAVEKALEVDDQLAGAWAGLAWMKRTYFWDWQGAKVDSDKALQLEPNNAMAIGTAASLASTLGDLDRSIELFERNLRSDPLSVSTMVALANRYRAAGRIEDTRRMYERVQALNPEYPGVSYRIAGTYLYEGKPEKTLSMLANLADGFFYRQIKAAALFDMGEIEKAQVAMDEFLELAPSGSPIHVALTFARRGEFDEAFRWLDKAVENREPNASFILLFPDLRRLNTDPRYPILLEKIGVREAWEAMPPEYGGPPAP